MYIKWANETVDTNTYTNTERSNTSHTYSNNLKLVQRRLGGAAGQQLKKQAFQMIVIPTYKDLNKSNNKQCSFLQLQD